MRRAVRLALAAAVLTTAACRIVADTEPHGIVVSTELRYRAVASHEFPRGVTLTVRATNQGPRRLDLALGRPPADGEPAPGAGAGFGLRILRADGSTFGTRYLPLADSTVGFAPGETRRQAFRLVLGTASPTSLPPGDYRLVGSFADTEAPAVRLRVVR